MTDPHATAAPSRVPVTKRWRVELGDIAPRMIEARGFRVEGGALIFIHPAGCVAAFAPGCWRTIEEAD
jgi:hypothetical protein